MTRKRDKEPRGPETSLAITIGLIYNRADETLLLTVDGRRRGVSDNQIANDSGLLTRDLPDRYRRQFTIEEPRELLDAALYMATAAWVNHVAPQAEGAPLPFYAAVSEVLDRTEAARDAEAIADRFEALDEGTSWEADQ